MVKTKSKVRVCQSSSNISIQQHDLLNEFAEFCGNMQRSRQRLETRLRCEGSSFIIKNTGCCSSTTSSSASSFSNPNSCSIGEDLADRFKVIETPQGVRCHLLCCDDELLNRRKAEGNKKYQAGDIQGAIDVYSQALADIVYISDPILQRARQNMNLKCHPEAYLDAESFMLFKPNNNVAAVISIEAFSALRRYDNTTRKNDKNIDGISEFSNSVDRSVFSIPLNFSYMTKSVQVNRALGVNRKQMAPDSKYFFSKDGESMYPASCLRDALTLWFQSQSFSLAAIILSNRAICHLKLGDWMSACMDATGSLTLCPAVLMTSLDATPSLPVGKVKEAAGNIFIKSLFRRAEALFHMGYLRSADVSCTDGLALVGYGQKELGSSFAILERELVDLREVVKCMMTAQHSSLNMMDVVTTRISKTTAKPRRSATEEPSENANQKSDLQMTETTSPDVIDLSTNQKSKCKSKIKKFKTRNTAATFVVASTSSSTSSSSSSSSSNASEFSTWPGTLIDPSEITESESVDAHELVVWINAVKESYSVRGSSKNPSGLFPFHFEYSSAHLHEVEGVGLTASHEYLMRGYERIKNLCSNPKQKIQMKFSYTNSSNLMAIYKRFGSVKHKEIVRWYNQPSRRFGDIFDRTYPKIARTFSPICLLCECYRLFWLSSQTLCGCTCHKATSSAVSKGEGHVITAYSWSPYPPPSISLNNSGRCNVLMDFYDLGSVLASVSGLDPVSYDFGLNIFAYSSNAYSLAKALVLLEMMQNSENMMTAVCQVWFDATWSEDTYTAFRDTLRRLLSNNAVTASQDWNQTGDEGFFWKRPKRNIPIYRLSLFPHTVHQCFPREVIRILEHWYNSERISLEEARRQWMQRHEFIVGHCVANMASAEDRADMCVYMLSGQLGVAEKSGTVGSVCMFALPQEPDVQPVANECPLNFFPLSEIYNSPVLGCDDFSFPKAFLHRFKIMIHSCVVCLGMYVRTKKLRIILIPEDNISPDNKILLKEIDELKPSNIVWHRAADLLSASDFHRMCRECSRTNNLLPPIHTVCSEKWYQGVYGASVVDWPIEKDTRAKLYEVAIKYTTSMNLLSRASFPGGGVVSSPLCHPINVVDWILSHFASVMWACWFISKSKVSASARDAVFLGFSPFCPFGLTVRFCILRFSVDSNIDIERLFDETKKSSWSSFLLDPGPEVTSVKYPSIIRKEDDSISCNYPRLQTLKNEVSAFYQDYQM